MTHHYNIVDDILLPDISEIVYNYMTIDNKSVKNNKDRLIRHFKRNMIFAVNYIYMYSDSVFNCDSNVSKYVLLACKTNGENSTLRKTYNGKKKISKIDRYVKMKNRNYYGWRLPNKRLIYSSDD